MPVRPVLTYPDPMLKSVAAACAGVDDEVREVARDLLETMRAHGR
ncbi:MAG TPA: peptide deformylase, partial [Actinomycetota bacterium]|nr:peptide deformylase [Actinomycetota bacterium]